MLTCCCGCIPFHKSLIVHASPPQQTHMLNKYPMRRVRDKLARKEPDVVLDASEVVEVADRDDLSPALEELAIAVFDGADVVFCEPVMGGVMLALLLLLPRVPGNPDTRDPTAAEEIDAAATLTRIGDPNTEAEAEFTAMLAPTTAEAHPTKTLFEKLGTLEAGQPQRVCTAWQPPAILAVAVAQKALVETWAVPCTGQALVGRQ